MFGQWTNQFQFIDSTGNLLTNRTVIFTPRSTPQTNAVTNIITSDRLRFVTDSNGSNQIVLWQGSYDLRMLASGGTGETLFTITVPTGHGITNGFGLISPFIDPSAAAGYTRSQSDARYMMVTNGFSTNQIGTNGTWSGTFYGNATNLTNFPGFLGDWLTTDPTTFAGGSATNATLLNGVAGAGTLNATNIAGSSNGIAAIVVTGSTIWISNIFDNTSGTATTNFILSTSNSLATTQNNADTTISNTFIPNLSGSGTNLNLYSHSSGVPLIVNKNTSGHVQEWNGTFGLIGYVADSGFAQFSTLASLGEITSVGSVSLDNGVFTSDGSGNVTAVSYAGSGSALTSLNASQLSSGTIPTGRYGTTVVQTNTGVILAITDGTHTSSNAIFTVTGTGNTTASISGNTLTINSSGGGLPGDGNTIATNTAGTKLITTNIFTTLTDGATISTDCTDKGAFPMFRVTLNGNRTLANPTAIYDGQNITWRVVQGTGTNTLTLGNAYYFGADVTTNSAGQLPLSTTAGKADWVKGIVISNRVEIVAITRGY